MSPRFVKLLKDDRARIYLNNWPEFLTYSWDGEYFCIFSKISINLFRWMSSVWETKEYEQATTPKKLLLQISFEWRHSIGWEIVSIFYIFSQCQHKRMLRTCCSLVACPRNPKEVFIIRVTKKRSWLRYRRGFQKVNCIHSWQPHARKLCSSHFYVNFSNLRNECDYKIKDFPMGSHLNPWH